ncbi:MAG: gfo/Idh/MocA family oxidoreductase, partial [Parafilimonas sp.]
DFLEKKTEIIKLKSDEDADAFNFDIETPSGNKTLVIINPDVQPVNAIKEELQSFVNSIIQNKTTIVNEIDGYLAMEVAHKILDKIRNTSNLS